MENKASALCFKTCCIAKHNKINILLQIIFGILYLWMMNVVKTSQGIIMLGLDVNIPADLSVNAETILFAPFNPFTERLMKKTASLTGKDNIDYNKNMRYFSNESQLMEEIERKLRKSEPLDRIKVVIFYDLTSSDEIPKNLKYRIRFSLDENNLKKLETSEIQLITFKDNQYINRGYIGLQQAINNAYQSLLGKDRFNITLFPMRDPRPRSIADANLIKIPLIIVLLFVQLLSILVPAKYIIKERALGVKELLRIMGLSFGMNWFGWYICGIVSSLIFLVMIFTTVIIILPNISFGVIFLSLILYFHASMWMTYALSILFGGTLTKYCGIYPYLLAFFVLMSQENLNRFWVVFLHFFPPLALPILFDNLKRKNNYSINVSGSLTTFSSSTDFTKSISFTLSMFAFDTLLYIFLVWYFEKVFPGKYGYAQPWYFLCKKVFSKNVVSTTMDLPAMEPMPSNKAQFQENVHRLEVSITIRNLYKCYGECTAVQNLSISLYKNQVTALLGSNGAGKTTLMSMITGMIMPTKGDIYIEGYDIKTDLKRIRKNISYCPQISTYFPYMNVKEHLIYAGLLKGLSCKKAYADTHHLLTEYGLGGSHNKMPRKLSGGMQRKLQLLMAVSGRSNVIVLDEPSSGLDPESRHELWNIITQIREGRTVIISTHIMEEADVLANQIAIMDQGVLQCYGEPMFLRNIYGVGYDLRVAMENSNKEKEITQIVIKSIPHAEVTLFTGNLALYQIPTLDSGLLSAMFSRLEAQKKELSIVSLGLAVRSIEYVFLKIRTREELATYSDKPIFDLKTGFGIIIWNIIALIYNLLIFIYRNCIIFLIFYVLVAILFGIKMHQNQQPPFNLYQHPIYTFEMKMNNFSLSNCYYSVEKKIEKVGNEFAAVVPNAIKVNNVLFKLIELAEENPAEYLRKTIISADILSEMTYGYYSMTTSHSAPELFNALSNAFVRASSGSDHSITASFQPMGDEISWSEWKSSFVIPIHMYILLLLIPFLIFFCNEKNIGVKRLQFLSGMDPIIYWFVYVLLTYILVFPFVVIIFEISLIKKNTPYKESADINFERKLIHLTLVSTILFYDLLTLVLKRWIFIIIPFAIQIILGLAAFIFRAKFLVKLNDGSKMFFPHTNHEMIVNEHIDAMNNFTLCQKVPSNIYKLCTGDLGSLPTIMKFCCDMECMDECTRKYLIGGSLQKMIATFAYVTIGYFLLIVILENNLIGKIFWCLNIFKSEPRSSVPDVVNEFKRVKENWHLKPNDENCDHLLVKNITKRYLNLNLAVKGVSFGFKRGECFGLLGTNGAGKTTLFKVLTHSLNASSGDAKINSINSGGSSWKLSTGWPCFLHYFGYCPQENSFNEKFTVYENLKMFSLLKGVPFKFLDTEINFWIDVLGLCQYKTTKSESLSGGNKRKLCVANALVGSKEIIYLDEPTSGVDPFFRHSLWRLLSDVRKCGQTIVLTSHSMDECEALCQRLVILVKGKMQCIGPIEYLKHNYTQGFVVQFRLTGQVDDATVRSINEAMNANFPTMLKEKTPGFLTMIVVDGSLTLSFLFGKIEALKKSFSHQIYDFTITDTSLEDIFILFANTQKRKR